MLKTFTFHIRIFITYYLIARFFNIYILYSQRSSAVQIWRCRMYIKIDQHSNERQIWGYLFCNFKCIIALVYYKTVKIQNLMYLFQNLRHTILNWYSNGVRNKIEIFNKDLRFTYNNAFLVVPVLLRLLFLYTINVFIPL